MFNAIEDPYWSSLVRNNILLAEGMAKEAADRESPDPEITLDEYMKVRRDTIGARQLFDLGRWIYKIDIPCEVLTHPAIVEIEDLFVDIVSLANTFCQVLTDLENQKQALPSFGENEDIQVAKYIKMVSDVVVGTIQWSLECGRYGHFGIAGNVDAPNWGDVVFDIDSF
ncbi:hypothetical protein C0993_001398 [Termitomyces sp. T159_Od127]|nr:hypothetical protein C0993_001398 [Termitomyces sp. T159_Od127]